MEEEWKTDIINYYTSVTFVRHPFVRLVSAFKDKVEKILKGSLDSIPSPSLSVKIQIMSLLEVWKQNIAGNCQQTFENKKFDDIAQQWFALLLQAYFPANNLNIHWRWRGWDRIQATF